MIRSALGTLTDATKQGTAQGIPGCRDEPPVSVPSYDVKPTVIRLGNKLCLYQKWQRPNWFNEFDLRWLKPQIPMLTPTYGKKEPNVIY